MKKLKQLFKDKRGFSDTVSMLGVALLLSILTIAGIVLASYIHNVTVLDRFADELVSKAALEGKCTGDEIDERYNELVKSTGLKPKVTFDANYYNNTKKTVQYGDSISVHVELELTIIGYGRTNYIKHLAVRTSTGQSMQYWKG